MARRAVEVADPEPAIAERAHGTGGSRAAVEPLRLSLPHIRPHLTPAAFPGDRLVRKGGSGNPVIVRGSADESLLVERVLSADESRAMPPPGRGGS